MQCGYFPPIDNTPRTLSAFNGQNEQNRCRFRWLIELIGPDIYTSSDRLLCTRQIVVVYDGIVLITLHRKLGIFFLLVPIQNILSLVKLIYVGGWFCFWDCLVSSEHTESSLGQQWKKIPTVLRKVQWRHRGKANRQTWYRISEHSHRGVLHR